MGKEAKLSTCMIVQQLKREFFIGWSEKELQDIDNANIKGIVNTIGTRLYNAGYAVQEIHGIIHDADVREVWDNTTCQYVVEQKPIHFHILCKFFKDGNVVLSGTLSQIANVIGLESQYIEKAGKGKYAYDNMLAYLIHIKYADKAQYKPELVYSAGVLKNNVPTYTTFMDYYRDRKKEWEEGRAKVKVQQSKIDIDILEEKILLGELTRNQILLTDSYFEIYARNKRRCDDAFDTFAQRKIARTIQAMENGEFKLSVFFVTGASHAGKSMFTDNLVKRLQKDAKEQLNMDWAVCSVAASNPFDEYAGEEILVMDDLRGMSLTPSDWLKLLDPDRVNTGSARYHNKKIACRAIIINSEKDVLDFFYYLKGNGTGYAKSEALDQFFRRILAKVVVYRVPDDADTRRVAIGSMQETAPHNIYVAGSYDEMGNVREVTLRHDFNKDLQDMAYDDAQDYLSSLVISRNKRNEN